MSLISSSSAEGIRVHAMHTDEKGRNVEGHRYDVLYETPKDGLLDGPPQSSLVFQYGPVGDHGNNGLQNEMLIAILVHRLEFLNRGDYECEENSHAIRHLQEALICLERRTLDRVQREVEGTNLP